MALSPAPEHMVRLVASDGSVFDVPVEEVKTSNTIGNMLVDVGVGTCDGNVIPIPGVAPAALRKVIEFMAGAGQAGADYCGSMDVDLLIEVTAAANYLDMPDLYGTCCDALAGMIRGRTVEQIRETFRIVNDFTPDEEAALRLENAWADDFPAAA
jgi:S-phase kinase-associated protein 1